MNIADYTFIANTQTTVTADSTTSAAKVEEFLIVCKLTNYGREYKVALNHPNMAYEHEVVFQLPSGNDASTDSKFRDTNKITDILLNGTSSSHWDSAANGIGFKTIRTDTGATLSSSQGLANYSGITSHFTFEAFDSVIYGKPTGTVSSPNTLADYTISSSDGSGNTAMYAIIDKIQDFSDTVDILSQVDLLVSTDAAPVHVGGALGVPVYLLLHYSADWRWFTKNLCLDFSPWYESVRIFRQESPQTWPDVIKKVEKNLQILINQ